MFDNNFSSHYISVLRLIQDSRRLPPRFLCTVRKAITEHHKSKMSRIVAC